MKVFDGNLRKRLAVLTPRRRRFLAWILLLFFLAAASGSLFGYLITIDIPQVTRLEDYRPPIGTKIYSDVGDVLYEFAGQKRVLIGHKEIPEVLRTAIIATEDARFYHHFGIDPRSILRAAVKDILLLRFAQGASTITQQLARNLFLKPEKTLWRKIQEAVLALQIEKVYTKEEILEFYCNQIYMGHGRYGLEAAARFYFGKPAADLDLSEAALLAGILQRPEALSPFKYPERALAKRRHVLNRMVREGYLTREDADRYGMDPLVLAEPQTVENVAPYFVEMIRQYLEERYGEESIYGEGMEVYSTLNLDLQVAANEAVRKGLLALDKRQGWRGEVRNLLAEGEGETGETVDLDGYQDPAWEEGITAGRILPGLVVAVETGHADVRMAGFSGRIGPEEIAWTKATAVSNILHRGDLALFLVREIDTDTGTVTLSLEQEPEVEGALIALDPTTGEIKALVGGYDFHRSQFNRAVQSQRQSGSAFKPIMYACALEKGFRPTDTFQDEPTVFVQDDTAPPYQPENYVRRYFGTTTLREALEDSRNIVSVKLFVDIGLQDGVEMARRMGIQSRLLPVPSLVLGAADVSLLELSAAYGIFPNRGVYVEPHFLRDVIGGDGRLREEADPAIREVMRADIAYLMNHLLHGVIESGTGKNARVLGAELAGKTGTTDDFTDAWFIGYTPSLVAGVWVGYDQKRSLGENETGARAALPIWIDFFREALAGRPEEHFQRPPNVVLIPIDRRTGLRASVDTGCSEVFLEAFVRGTEPAAYCSPQEHFRLTLPYFLQAYHLGKRNDLRISSGELLQLMRKFPYDLELVDSGRFLEVHTAGRPEMRIPLTMSRRERQATLSAMSLADLPWEKPVADFWDWAAKGSPVGVDGRPAHVEVIDGGS